MRRLQRKLLEHISFYAPQMIQGEAVTASTKSKYISDSNSAHTFVLCKPNFRRTRSPRDREQSLKIDMSPYVRSNGVEGGLLAGLVGGAVALGAKLS